MFTLQYNLSKIVTKLENYQSLKDLSKRLDFLSRHLEISEIQIWKKNQRINEDGSPYKAPKVN